MEASNESMVLSSDDESVLDAFAKAFQSAVANNLGAVSLTECGRHALAASIAIAALEEIGKMMLLDDLLFARSLQPRHHAATKGRLAHYDKLEAVDLYSRFLQCLSSDDPRRHEPGHKRVIAVGELRFEASKQKLSDLLGREFRFRHLHALRRRGLYSHTSGGTVRVNREAADPELTKAIVELVRCITDTLRLVLGASFEHYRNLFGACCDGAGRASRRTIQKNVAEQFTSIFDPEIEIR
jgi:AbiV family abortive infection protein